MERLTKKKEKDYFGCEYDLTDCHENIMYANTIRINKLGQLEDEEQGLGIELLTLIKALKQGYVFIKKSIYKQKITYVSWNKKYIQVRKSYHIHLNMNDYGNTWALTKEELEHD